MGIFWRAYYVFAFLCGCGIMKVRAEDIGEWRVKRNADSPWENHLVMRFTFLWMTFHVWIPFTDEVRNIIGRQP